MNIRNIVPFAKGVFRVIGNESAPPTLRKRADARRNEESLLDAAAAAFVASGVEVPVRDIAARAGVGVATIYRHFPTRSDLIVAVYRHQVEACAEAGPTLLASSSSPHAALARWINLFVDFLVTKHGLAEALKSDDATFAPMHAYFVDRLVPVLAGLLEASVNAGQIRPIRMPSSCCSRSVISASALVRARVTTLVAWWRCSSKGCGCPSWT